ncbi:hypothetical protein [Legionella longbeachae]|uniref:Uncharacterized protein n=1 Tax=Legionella longbeachae serogroup 1 (strain NSW150) TaxID=661367 RepID=D3HRC3_LEGLN|nr:hypothetical protein [Legionella longbeachae]VEE01957.1 Uncharacterised protein [Legionella oakridgensis]HBD7396791.1 hypothetical protein [Legionella pneumophila]ARB91731.1 hypothetical protein A6J40_05840 [Legionella longbeachae]ARM35123.1 hypothetical protein B0B39_17115 [Legionella longbeachae]EEZ95437.1 conserved hypothetical protein [Legionella longbeachae D-4968]
MARDKINVDDVGKTVTIAALLNTVLAPLYWADAKIGLSAALVATGAFLYGAHEIGKKRRPAANGINSLNTFFGGATGDKSTEVQNAVANIVVGGKVIFDEVFPDSNKPGNR